MTGVGVPETIDMRPHQSGLRHEGQSAEWLLENVSFLLKGGTKLFSLSGVI